MVAMWSFGSSGSNGNSLDLCTKYRDEPAERWWQTANVNQFFVPPLLRYVQELGGEWNSVTMMLTRVWKLWLADKQQQQGAQDPEEGFFFTIYSLIYAIFLLISPLRGRHLHRTTSPCLSRLVNHFCVRLLKQMPQTIFIFIFSLAHHRLHHL